MLGVLSPSLPAVADQADLRFPVDHDARAQLLPHGSVVGDIFPAKMSLGLLAHLVRRYTRAGDVVLDPFAGCGTTMLAALEGRHTILVELESHWIDACQKNAAHLANEMLTPPPGEIVIRQGDSRYDLAAALMPPFADTIVTSPPYLDSVGGDHGRDPHPERTDGGRGLAQLRAGYSVSTPAQADVVLTSPPYTNDIGRAGRSHGPTHYLDRMGGGRVIEAQHQGYSAPAPAVDAIVTSPPYADRYAYKDPETRQADDPTAGVKGRVHRPYSQNPANIGNLRGYGTVDAVLTSPLEHECTAGQTYLEAMALVYAQCYAALKPGGLCVVVIGNVVRDGRELRLDRDTTRLLEASGFVLREVLVHRKRPSFFRNLTRQRKPELPVIDCERVLVAEKRSSGSGSDSGRGRGCGEGND